MIGNWKMNQSLEQIQDFFVELKLTNNQNNFWIAPQALHISKALELASKVGVLIGAQNCSDQNQGAFTGENSTDSLVEIGCHFTLIGHSERRTHYNESDIFINRKVAKAIEKGLIPVLCVGETLSQREAGQTNDIVLGQVKAGLNNIQLNNESELIIAYEPVWAIGTGRTATPEQAGEVHNEIRHLLTELYGEIGREISILYGGSIKPSNINELMTHPNINGALVGGASLKADSYYKLCNACSL